MENNMKYAFSLYLNFEEILKFYNKTLAEIGHKEISAKIDVYN